MNYKADCVIFAGAAILNKESVNGYLNCGAYYICADSGLYNAEKLGIVPDMLVGDFDSSCVPLDFKGEIVKFPPEKNDTDLSLAASVAIEKGFKNIAILGAFGGRPDHTLAAVSTLELIAGKNLNAKIVTDNGEITFLREKTEYEFKKEDKFRYFSLIPLDGTVYGITLKGFKYPLTNKTAKRSETLCISNELTSSSGLVRIEKGSALAVVSYDT